MSQTLFTPANLGKIALQNRVVMAPMTRNRAAENGVPTELMAEHYGQRGDAGLIVAEGTWPEVTGQAYCRQPGIETAEHVRGWQRVTDAVHARGGSIVLQIMHSGRIGSHHIKPQGVRSVSSSALQAQGQIWTDAAGMQDFDVPVALSTEEVRQAIAEHAAAAKRAMDAGFDGVELHGTSGYLCMQFMSSSTNQRSDEYGGSLENRLRFPLEVFKAMRAVWPQDKPMSVRISAHDWVPGGITPENAVQIAKAFKAAGADLIDCSSGQVSKLEKPVFGRMYQTPFADRIRQEADIATMAVGAISEADHANSIIAAGRADLCAVARPHLANPAWTLTEAAKIGYTPIVWPKQYFQGKRQMEALFEREKAQQAGAK